MSLRLLEVAVPCLRYHRTRYFYEQALGLKIDSQGRHHVFFEAGGARIALVDASEGDASVQPSGHGMYLDLAARDLGQLRRQLERERVAILEERSDRYGKAITVRDPEGNLINIFQEGTVD